LDVALLFRPYSVTLLQAFVVSVVLLGVLVTIFFGDEEDPPAPGHLLRHPVLIALDLVVLVLMLVFLGPIFWRMFTPAIPGF
jgi:NADH:ubiquinone oxidoreductase subunit 5 (subunit L)/multisubunit Na+/H+ antiporter MnhA subunit